MPGRDEPSVRLLFATPLIELFWGGASAVEALAAAVSARRSASPGVDRSNLGGWHSDTEMLKWGGPVAKDLALKTLETCAAFTTDLALLAGGAPRYEFGLEMWANASPAGATNAMHAHPGAQWSAVYYLDDGGDAEEGALSLLDPRYPMNRAHASDLAFVPPGGAPEETSVKVRPEAGKLVIFPAWLMHAVRPHRGARDRISVAMNVIAMPARRRP